MGFDLSNSNFGVTDLRDEMLFEGENFWIFLDHYLAILKIYADTIPFASNTAATRKISASL